MAALAILSWHAAAQTNEASALADSSVGQNWATLNSGQWRMGFSADYSAVAARSVSFDGASGRSGAQSVNATLTGEIPVNQQWFVPFGLASRNIFLGGVAGAPIPSEIDTLGLGAGAGWHYNDRWTFVATVGPRFYRLDEFYGGDVGIGGLVRATYRWKPNLTLALGLSFEPERDIPVLPAAGLRWEIQTNLILSLMFPRTGLDYRVKPRLDLFAGLDGNFTVFRAESDLGNKIGLPQYNNGLGTYRDFRLGVGAEYRLVAGLSAQVEGGYSFAREIDYTRIGQKVDFGSAPFVAAALRYRF